MASETTFRLVHNTRRYTWKCGFGTSCQLDTRIAVRSETRRSIRECFFRTIVWSAQSLADQHQRPFGQDSLAEWSKGLAPGASPQGRGFEPHSCHSAIMHTGITFAIVKSHHHTKRTCYTLVITRNECPARLGALGAGYFSMLIFARLLDPPHCQPCNPIMD